MNVESKELEEYVQSTLTAISKGVSNVEGFRILKPIKFNVAVVNTKEGGGGLKVFVASAEGKLKSEEVSHIEFEVQPPSQPAQIIYPDHSRSRGNPAL